MATDADKILGAARIGAARPKSYWVRAWRSTDQAVASTSTAVLSFDRSEQAEGGQPAGLYDPQNMHDPIGDPTRFYARMVRGIYRVDFFAYFSDDPDPGVFLRLNGTVLVALTYTPTVAATASANPLALTDVRLRLNPNDYLEIYEDNSANGSAANVTSLSTYAPIFQLQLLESEHG